MSKYMRYWMLVMMAICLSPLMLYAEGPEPEIEPEPEPVKEYVKLDTVYVGIYPTQTPYLWRSMSLDESGIYFDTVKVPEITDKDTIYTLDLTIKEYVDGGTTTADVYPTQLPYKWRNEDYTSSGTYKDTAKATDFTNPDTIYTLVLTVKEYVDGGTTTANIYPTQLPYKWRNEDYTSSGTYVDTAQATDFTSPDTIYTLVLTVKEYVDGGTVTDGIYPQETPYYWRGHGYETSGTYKDTAQATDFTSPDTIYTLKLYVKAYHEMVTKKVGVYPTQLPYSWRNKEYNKSGTYVDTVKVADFAKKDTIYSLQLTVKEYFKQTVEKKTICSNQASFKWRGKVRSKTGIYVDTVKMTDFAIADTIYTLDLSIGDASERHESFHFCPGGSISFRGKTYTETTIDTIRLKSVFGCDSLIIVHVTTYDNYLFKENETLCNGSSYIWKGHGPLGGDLIISSPGVYYDSLQTIHGCDSVFELRVVMGYPALYKDTVAICEEDLPYPFGGKWLTETGVYYDTIARGGHQCDSIIRLALTVLKDQYEEKTVTFCEGTGARHRGGEIFYDARTYIDTLLTPGEGCYHIIKTVYQPQETYRFEEWKHRSEGQKSYQWHGKTYTKDGIYTESYTSVGGCDSIWVLHLMTDYDRTLDSIACQGDTLFYKGKAVYNNCIFTDSLVTKWGGDSVVHLSFRFMPRYYNIEKTSICSNEYIPWPGHEHIMLHEEGAYYDRYQTVYGCDSIFEIDVTVNKAYSNDTVVYVSEYERQDWAPFIWTDGHGKKHELVNDTVIIDTLGHTPLKYEGDYLEGDIWHRALSGGCDSTVSIHFIVIRKYNLDTIPMCPGSSVYVDGKEYTVPGDYKHFLVSSPSALYSDSIHYFHIFEADVYDSEEYDIDSVCSNELPYHWYHRVCYASGEYKDTLQTIYGCDSIVHLHLIVKPSYSFPLIYNLCSGDSVMVNGRYIHEPGLYYDSLLTKEGCDSVYRIVVNRVRTYFMPDTAHFRQGTSYMWHKDGLPWELTAPGVYYDSCRTVADGCDSIYRLLLIEDRTFFFTENQTTCENELPYHWHNQYIYTSGTYYDSLQTIYSMDSVYELNLTVYDSLIQERVIKICPNESFVLHDSVITTSGTYTDKMVTQHGCDSIIIYHVSIVPSYFKDERLHMGKKTEVPWHGKTLTMPGVYLDSLQTTEGCDSIFRLTLIEDLSYTFYDTIRVCQSELPKRWQGVDYSVAGDYNRAYNTKYGMDSVYHLHLEVYPTYETSTYIDRCTGDFFELRGRKITKSGDYVDTLSTLAGCDSIIHTIVNFRPTFFESDTLHLVQGTPISWHGKTFTSAGVYYDSCQTVNGCDSIYRLLLIEDKTYFFPETQTVCENELPYHWHDKYIYTSGTYYDSLHTVLALDSVYELTLTVYDSLIQERVIKICPNESFVLHDSVITTSGTYIDKMVTEHGCDSIIIYHVSIVPSYFKDEQLHMGNKTEVPWHGKTLTMPGVYFDSLQTTEGCDSIFRLTLIEDISYMIYDTAHVCQNAAPYIWQGGYYYTSGDYTRAYVSKYGMDSICHLHLTVNPAYEVSTSMDRCAGDYFDLRGRRITKSGDYVDTLSTSLGCDSIVHTIVNFHPSFFEDDTLHLINGTSVTWHGQELSVPGVYFDSSTTVLYGCDSIYRLNLQLADTFSYTETVIACEEDLPYHWHGQSLMETGTYADIHKTAHNADSCYYIHFTVAPKYFSTSNATLCHGGQLNYLRRVIREPGVYNDTLLSVYGCDSIIQLIVNWADVKLSEQQIMFCRGESYTVNGRTFTQSGVYEDTLRTADGCDSVVRYSVHVFETYFFDEQKSIKPGQQYIWTGHLNDQLLTKAGVYFDSLQTVNGCDSIYRLTLSIKPEYLSLTTVDICASDIPYLWRGKYYDHSGIYDDTLQTQEQCDSIFRLTLNVHETSLEDRFYDFCSGQEVGLGGHTFTKSGIYYDTVLSEYGCPLVVRHVVRFHPSFHIAFSKTLAEGESYDFYGRILTQPGKYVHTEPTQYGCDSVIELTISVCTPKPEVLVNMRLCTGDSVQIGDTTITQPGQYYRTYPSQYGCDSVVHYVVQPNPVYHWMMRDSFCMGNPYTWFGHLNDTVITLPGRYEERLKTVDGCDSIYSLLLTASAAFLYDTTVYVCYNELPYIHKGEEYFTDMEFRDTLRAQTGCDSVVITRYRLNHHCSDLEIRTRCEGEILVIDGHTIVDDGEYRFQVNADSVHRFLVASYPVYDYTRNIGSFCDSVEYEGETYYARGIGKETFTVDRYMRTVHECDSIEHVTMTIYASAPTLQHTQHIYDYSSVWFGGQLYNETGTYTHNYHTVHGCDSTVILHLNVTPTDSTGALHFSYCFANKDNLEVFGKYYHPAQDTIIFDTTAIPDVGMFIIKKALVHVTYPFTIKSVQAESEVCAEHDIDFNIEYTLNGSYPYYYELDFLNAQLGVTPNHQEGLVNQRTVIPVTMSGQGLCVRPGIYPYRLKLTAEDCHMSDTIITGSITVRYPSDIMEANWDNVVAIVNENFNAGRWKLIPPYTWQVYDEFGIDKTALVNPDPARSYLYSDQLKPGDRIIVTLTREGYNNPVPSCEYIFYPVITDERVPVLVYPTAVRKMSPVTIEATEDGSYTLYDYAGVRIENGVFSDGTQTVTLPAVSGCYIMRLNLQSGATQTHKLIVY